MLRITRYPDLEVLVVDNGSDDPATLRFLAKLEQQGKIRVLRDPSPFNYSALNNLPWSKPRARWSVCSTTTLR